MEEGSAKDGYVKVKSKELHAWKAMMLMKTQSKKIKAAG